MMLYRLLIVVICLSSLSVSGQQLSMIKGKIINVDGLRPLADANVFISNSTRGTRSDANGYFEFPGLPDGGYKLIVSFVGFATQVVIIHTDNEKIYTIALKPAVMMLDELTISSGKESRSAWVSNYKTFKDYFIGLSDNARSCSITNPRALHFVKKNGMLTARADTLLVIVNDGLGYEITFLLEEFQLNLITNTVKYKGHMAFEELPVDDEKVRIKRAASRLKAYYGSQMHFMRSLYKRNLANDGFYSLLFTKDYDGDPKEEIGVSDTVLRVQSKIFDKKIRVFTLTNYNRILDSAKSTLQRPILNFKGQLEVTYVDEAESYDYLRTRNKRNIGYTMPQRSRIVLLSHGLEIESNGVILDEENLVTRGYWSWELVSESLPIDYDPAADAKLVQSVRSSD